MQCDIVNLEAEKVGNVELKEDIFAVPVNANILHAMVLYQRAKRQRGTHKTLERGEIHGSNRKLVAQKRTGRARRGDRHSNVLRGGTKAFGPTPRSHAIKLPHKVRRLALKQALASKVLSKELLVLEDTKVASPKTKNLCAQMKKLQLTHTLIVDSPAAHDDFCLAARNIPNLNVLPVKGINVYDILRHKKLVITKAALKSLEERFA